MLHPTQRPIHWPALIETTLLGGAAAVLLTKALRGVLTFYVHPRYTPLIIVCGLLLLLVAGTRMRSIFSAPEPVGKRRWQYALLAVPLLLGTLVPARPLGAGAMADTGLGSAAQFGGATLPADPTQWDLLNWATTLSVRDDLGGKPADVIGFVYRDPKRPFAGFFVTRYVVTCCTADSSGVGLPVVWKDASTFPADAWVRVRGTIGTTKLGEHDEPALLATTVERVPQPEHPYLYP